MNFALRFAASIGFLIILGLVASGQTVGINQGSLLVIAAVIGGYMAMNIGANDVANNVGPAVGSRALTLLGAIVIAGIFEALGAIVAGGDVVSTIKGGIIDPEQIGDTQTFIWVMTAALLAGAVWLNAATAVGAPVSTTHSIVGGVLGAGIAAGGFGIANWSTMGSIAASWVISPVMGGGIAAAFLYVIKRQISYQTDMLAAAQKVVPVLVGLMAWAFTTYLVMKGLKHIWKVDFTTASILGAAVAAAVYALVKPSIRRRAPLLSNDKDGVNSLFRIPLIFAAALLSFAHGANDVANAVGPLAAINEAILHGSMESEAGIPMWVMLVGALGIAIGLALYGPRLIKTVGSEITELDQSRAFCIAMAAAITVIIASQLGLPVSSTHIAVGGVFGVGFLRERIKLRYARMIEEINLHHHGDDAEVLNSFLREFEEASIRGKQELLRELKSRKTPPKFTKSERKEFRKVYREELVKRTHVTRIIAAWFITVPASAALSAFVFFAIRGFMLP